MEQEHTQFCCFCPAALRATPALEACTRNVQQVRTGLQGEHEKCMCGSRLCHQRAGILHSSWVPLTKRLHCAIPLPADQYNPYVGKTAGDCLTCDPNAVPRLTSDAGAASCTVPYVDRVCSDGALRGEGLLLGQELLLLRADTCHACAATTPSSHRPLFFSQATNTTPTPLPAPCARRARSAWLGVRTCVCPGEPQSACGSEDVGTSPAGRVRVTAPSDLAALSPPCLVLPPPPIRPLCSDPGTYSAAGATNCTACPAGQYTSVSGTGAPLPGTEGSFGKRVWAVCTGRIELCLTACRCLLPSSRAACCSPAVNGGPEVLVLPRGQRGQGRQRPPRP